MCFSAGASFAVGALLFGAGVTTVMQVREPARLPLALIPLIFSVQQFCEGMIWLSFSNATYTPYGEFFTYVFLIFAQVVWPLWVPLSMWLVEPGLFRKMLLAGVLAVGIAVSVYLAYCILCYGAVAGLSQHHIRYDLKVPAADRPYSGVFYLLPTVLAPFLSSVKKMWMIGAALFVSFMVSKIFFDGFVVSVWCYFAAAISAGIFFIVKRNPARRAGLA